MKGRVLCAVALLATGCASTGARPASTALERELREADRARDEALRNGDTASLERLYADDFVMVTSTGQIRTKADQLREIGAGAIQHQGPDETFMDVALYGDAAVVHAASAPNTLVTDGVPDSRARRYTRVYVRRDGRWQLRATHISVVADAGVPVLAPYFGSAAPEVDVAFYVECRNTSAAPIATASRHWPLDRSALRIDGRTLADQPGLIGPGLIGQPIAAGETWSGIIELRRSASGSTGSPLYGAMVRTPFQAPLDPGRHRLAVRCGDTWSPDVEFYVEKGRTP